MSLKDAKINFLVDIATDLFMARSISEVTIKDIAIAAEVGEATIYRYFGSKQNIVIQAAMKIQDIVSADFFDLSKCSKGFDKLKVFYESYYEIFIKHPTFYKFLNEFDAYVSIEDASIINPYESAIDAYKNSYMEGSLRSLPPIEMRPSFISSNLVESREAPLTPQYPSPLRGTWEVP